jgi:hypothetical protein
MRIIPLELSALNVLVETLHGHHKAVRGHRFSIGLESNGKIVGGASIGRPTARLTNQHEVLEVTRLVTDGTANACSALYSAAARIGKAMGYRHIQTFILQSESGVSLKAAGWKFEQDSAGGSWTRKSKPNRRQDQPQSKKQRWGKDLA